MTKLSDLPVASSIADDDLVYVVDASDTSEDPAGSSKQATMSKLVGPALTVAAKVVLQSITDPASGYFEFTVPNGYQRLIIQGQVRSDDASTNNGMNIWMNADEVAANYFRQRGGGSNGNSTHTEGNNSFLSTISAGNSPAGAYASMAVVIEAPDSAVRKVAVCTGGALETSSEMNTELCAVVWDNTAALTTIKLATGSGANALGTLTLYGEKQVQIRAI